MDVYCREQVVLKSRANLYRKASENATSVTNSYFAPAYQLTMWTKVII